MGFKNWYDAHVVPRMIKVDCANDAISDRRAQVVPREEGRVFEIGCGGGLNQPFSAPHKVTAFAGLDPSGKLLEYRQRLSDFQFTLARHYETRKERVPSSHAGVISS